MLMQEQLLFRHKVVTPKIDEALERFHHRAPISSDNDSIQQGTRQEQPQESKVGSTGSTIMKVNNEISNNFKKQKKQ